jgi:hypothetical protein
MMAGSTCSNQRPDTLMQDRIARIEETSCTARPDHTSGSSTESLAARLSRLLPRTADIGAVIQPVRAVTTLESAQGSVGADFTSRILEGCAGLGRLVEPREGIGFQLASRGASPATPAGGAVAWVGWDARVGVPAPVVFWAARGSAGCCPARTRRTRGAVVSEDYLEGGGTTVRSTFFIVGAAGGW